MDKLNYRATELQSLYMLEEQCSGGAGIYEWMQKRKQRLSLCACRCLSEQLPQCASMCAFIRASMRLYVPLCVPLLARATAWLPDSAWESAFTAPPCSTRPRQACPFLPLQRQYNHQMTQTTIRTVHSVFPPPSSTKPQDPWHRPFNLHSQRK